MAGRRPEVPNPKFQIPNKSQIPNPKPDLELETWNLERALKRAPTWKLDLLRCKIRDVRGIEKMTKYKVVVQYVGTRYAGWQIQKNQHTIHPKEWLGQTTAKEMSKLLEEIYNSELASRTSTDAMISILRRQFYRSRLPRLVRFEGVAVAHKTGDWPPVAGNDVGILFHKNGPTIVSVFINQNRGDFTKLEETIGQIAAELIAEWSPQ